MTNSAKTKGDRAERAFVAHIAPHWPNARRGKAGAEADLGDIFGIVDRAGDAWTVQVADRKWRSHGEIVTKAREAREQAERAGTPFWCMVVKRPGFSDVAEWFVYLPTWVLWWRLDLIDGNRPYPAEDLASITVRAWLSLTAPRVESVVKT